MGEERIKDLLRSLFNPYEEIDNDSKLDLEDFLKEFLDESGNTGRENQNYYWDLYNELMKHFDERFAEVWLQEFRNSVDFDTMGKFKRARRQAWEQLLEMIREGIVDPSDISMSQMVRTFHSEIIEALEKEEYIQKTLRSRITRPKFTFKGEKLLGKRILEVSMSLLKKGFHGIHEVEAFGSGLTPGANLEDYDEVLHTFDMIDIQESCLTAAIKDPLKMELKDEFIKVRTPHQMVRCSIVILIDCSDSMKGHKMIGAIEAALGLKELLEEEYKEDRIWVAGFNHTISELQPGEIANLRPYGTTDIGLALNYARRILMKEDENRSIFLITDGEPTTSAHSRYSPIESALRESYHIGKEDITLNIIMLDSHPRLKYLCVEMAKRAEKAHVAFVNPINLKEFIIRSYISHKYSRF
jgi:Ca-activated chloride channel family protein